MFSRVFVEPTVTHGEFCWEKVRLSVLIVGDMAITASGDKNVQKIRTLGLQCGL
jgi:hypothetical protein